MNEPLQSELLRIFIGESDRHYGRPLYEVIVERAREFGLAGATVLRGTLGYGGHSQIHSAKILRLSEDLPMVIEIVDKPELIDSFMQELHDLMQGGIVTRENVRCYSFAPKR